LGEKEHNYGYEFERGSVCQPLVISSPDNSTSLESLKLVEKELELEKQKSSIIVQSYLTLLKENEIINDCLKREKEKSSILASENSCLRQNINESIEQIEDLKRTVIELKHENEERLMESKKLSEEQSFYTMNE
jgi:hypothetical protein